MADLSIGNVIKIQDRYKYNPYYTGRPGLIWPLYAVIEYIQSNDVDPYAGYAYVGYKNIICLTPYNGTVEGSMCQLTIGWWEIDSILPEYEATEWILKYT